jgi:undecaprenyl-diphosphatase
MIYALIQKIKEIDYQLFYFVQYNFRNSIFDKWMPIITDYHNWTWLIIIGWLALFFFGGKKGKIACIILIITILFADNLSSYVLKPFFGRLRPNDITSFSFPSNHAINIFALAMILSWYYRKSTLVFFTIACLVGFSRIYIGVHYPLDVAAGAIVGVTCATFFIWCAYMINKRFA